MEEPDIIIGTNPGEYRDLDGFQQALSGALTERYIPDLTLTQDRVAKLQANYNENPPGTGQSDKKLSLTSFLIRGGCVVISVMTNKWLMQNYAEY